MYSRDIVSATTRFGDLDIDIIEQPGRCLRKEDVFDDVIEVVAEARGWTQARDKEALRATYKFKPFLDADTVVVVHHGGRPRGFCSFRKFISGNNRVLHMSNAAMLPELQDRGVMLFVGLYCPAFAATDRAEFLASVILERQYVTFISQSPVVYGAMRKRGLLFPDVKGRPPPAHVARIAKMIAGEINPHLEFDEHTFVIRKECSFFYQEVPRYHDPIVNAFMDRSLNYAAGDVIVGVLQLSTEALKKAFQSAEPPKVALERTGT